ncbi:MAG: TlpA disulfide reductase family protein [Myxococcota bacterium]
MHFRIRTALLGLVLALLTVAPASAREPAPEPEGAFGQQLHVLPEPVPVPEYIFREAGGREWGFVEFRDQVVVASFWATWCGVCRTELPKLDRLQESLGKQGIRVVALVQDIGADEVEGVLRKRGLSHLRAFEDVDDVLSATLGVYGIPTSFVIGPDGYILASVVGPADWNSPEARRFLLGLRRSGAPPTTPLNAPYSTSPVFRPENPAVRSLEREDAGRKEDRRWRRCRGDGFSREG